MKFLYTLIFILLFYLVFAYLFDTYSLFRLYLTGAVKEGQVSNLRIINTIVRDSNIETYEFDDPISKREFEVSRKVGRNLKNGQFINVFVSPYLKQGNYLDGKNPSFWNLIGNRTVFYKLTFILTTCLSFFITINSLVINSKNILILSKMTLNSEHRLLIVLHHLRSFLPFLTTITFTISLTFLIAKSIYSTEYSNRILSGAIILFCMIIFCFLPHFIFQLRKYFQSDNDKINLIKQVTITIMLIYGTIKTIIFIASTELTNFSNLLLVLEEYVKSLFDF